MDNPPTHPLLTPVAGAAIERAVSEHVGARWQARDFRDLHDLSSHPSAILSDGEHAVFAKLCSGANAAHQLEVEQAGLRLLAERAGVLIPTLIAVVEADAGAIFLTEAIEEIERGPEQWRAIGQALAQVHRIKAPLFGLDRSGYFGPVYQDNRPLPDWPTFFAERRMWPRLIAAIDSGHLTIAMAHRIERIIARLPDLCGPGVAPTLLHGDAQKNNFISSATGAYVIDPAVHFGHPEFDLALIDYFEAVPGDVYDGYRDVLPIDTGFAERKHLWRIPAWLAVVQHAGADYLPMLETAVQPYA